MIIPPSDKPASSRILKWTLRLLVLIVVLALAMLFALTILSGTSDTHRHAFENFMSEAFKSNVEITELKSFNVVPQLLLDANGIKGDRKSDGKKFTIGHLRLAYGFSDLMFSKNRIEDLQVSDLVLDPGMLGPQETKFSNVSIIHGEKPQLTAQGTFGTAPFSAMLGVDGFLGVRPSYAFAESAPASVVLGDLHIDGIFARDGKGRPSLQEAVLKVGDTNIAQGEISLQPPAENLTLSAKFTAGKSKGSLVNSLSENSSEWSFDTLDMEDVTGGNPGWARVASAWHRFLGGGLSGPAGGDARHVTVSIATLTGGLDGHTLKGEFLSFPDRVIGWWSGDLGTHGNVSCGFVVLQPKGDEWISDFLAIDTDNKDLNGKLSVNTVTGKIVFKPAETKQVSVPGVHQKLFNDNADRLSLTGTCQDLLKSSSK